MMKVVCKIALVGQVWLTAAMTLVAGLPHFPCRCPDGHVKLFCMGLALGGRTCCDRNCCSPVPEPARKACCCCGHGEARHTSRSSMPECQAQPAGCVRSQAPTADATPAQTKSVEGSAANLLAPLPSAKPLAPAPLLSAREAAWQLQTLPPPTDLITLLHHLLI